MTLGSKRVAEEEKVKTVNLNIMLLKSECNFDNRSDYIENYSDENVIIKDTEENNYYLYKNGRAGQKPSWVLEFDKNIWKDSIKDKFANTASEGLSVIKQLTHNDNKYLFAINFGQGWHNIIKDKIDETFGIYTAIALIDQGANIRRAGTRNISSNPKNTEFQNAQELSRETFNAELEDNDIIRHLNAVANSPTISSVIGKYGPLNIRMRFKESELPCWDYLDERLSTLIDLYENVQANSDIVNQFFKGLRPLPSKKQQELNSKLKEKLSDENSKFFLFEPEIDYDSTLVASIKYKLTGKKRNSESFENLSLDDYLKLRENFDDINLAQDKVILLNEEGNKYKEWSVLKCLYGEIRLDNQVYILSNAVWYGLPADKYERINKNIENIIEEIEVDEIVKTNTKDKILEEKKEQQKNHEKKHIEKERIFNTEFCNQLNGELLDQIAKQITIDGDKMEICDILDPAKKEFIHSKIGTNAANLSHLFNQGYVSARAFASMKEIFVPKVNEKFENAQNKLSNTLNSHQEYTIRYLIINDKSINKLTFISKLALDRIITDLKGFGYNVKLSWVDGIDLNPELPNQNANNK